MLRRELDRHGYNRTVIVAQDGGTQICTDMAKDQEYAAAVGVIGLHYPSDFYSLESCHALGKPVWASEESSSYDDLNGTAQGVLRHSTVLQYSAGHTVMLYIGTRVVSSLITTAGDSDAAATGCAANTIGLIILLLQLLHMCILITTISYFTIYYHHLLHTYVLLVRCGVLG